MEQLALKKSRLNALDSRNLKSTEYKKTNVQLRLEPYEAKLVQHFLNHYKKEENIENELEKYLAEKMPWKIDPKHVKNALEKQLYGIDSYGYRDKLRF